MKGLLSFYREDLLAFKNHNLGREEVGLEMFFYFYGKPTTIVARCHIKNNMICLTHR